MERNPDPFALSGLAGRVKEFSMVRYRLRFGRKGLLRFLSHLEQIQLIRRIFRRTEIEIEYTQGFHPQPKISFGPAISVGYESESEYIDMVIKYEVEMAEFARKVNRFSPDKFFLLGMKTIPDFLPSLEPYADVAEYHIVLPGSIQLNQLAGQEIKDKLLVEEKILIKKIKKDKEEMIDARSLIRDIKFNADNVVVVLLRFGPGKNIKPGQLIKYFFEIPDGEVRKLGVMRKQLYHESPDLQLLPLL